MMYMRKVSLTNVRSYESAELNLGEGGGSILICGNNGTGKTTLLRSIALGLCDHISAGALLRDLPGDFIRKSANVKKKSRNAVIKIDLSSALGRETYAITTTLKTRRDVGFEWVETKTTRNGQLRKEYEFPWQQIFVVAYGAGLRTAGSEDYVQYLAPDAVYSLFDYAYPLHNPELAWRRLLEVARDPES
jgi:predicted ATPase